LVLLDDQRMSYEQLEPEHISKGCSIGENAVGTVHIIKQKRNSNSRVEDKYITLYSDHSSGAGEVRATKKMCTQTHSVGVIRCHNRTKEPRTSELDRRFGVSVLAAWNQKSFR